MECWYRTPASIVLGGMLLIGSGGCISDEPSSGSGSQAGGPQTVKATKPSPSQKAETQTPTGELTTPDRRIDTKELSKVVKEEVRGGEALEGPTPFDYLWAPSTASLIKDEELKVEVPAGFDKLIAKVNVPVANPITKGKYELGRQLYFDPRVSLDGTVSCATCHNPAKGWTDQLAVSIGIDGQAGSRSARAS